MQSHRVEFTYEELDRDELTDEERADLEAATRARDLLPHAPYSRYHVGVALRAKDDTVSTGANAESIIHKGVHAEYAAVCSMPEANRRSGVRRVTVVGSRADHEDSEPVAPCGECRQHLLEYVQPDDNPVVVMAGVRGKVHRAALKDLLPLAFYPATIAQ